MKKINKIKIVYQIEGGGDNIKLDKELEKLFTETYKMEFGSSGYNLMTINSATTTTQTYEEK